MLSQIESVLKTHNGKRRTRLLDINDIIRIISESLEDGKASTGGGHVSNSYLKYGFNQIQTIASAIKKDSFIEIRISTNSARKGSSQYPKKGEYDIILTVGQARRLVSRWRVNRGEYKVLPKKLKDLVISRDDSIMVGNCEFYTDKIINEIGKNIGTAGELFSFVKNNYPDQLGRALRVINYVSKRSKQ